jgi:transposase-like protein
MDTLSAPHFHDDTAAREYLEELLWPEGPICCHCGIRNHAYATKRPGVYRCGEPTCRKDFTVTMRTVMERSKIALHKWLQAFHLMCSSKKGVSAHQLHRTLDIGYEAAWFMAHRIREAMRNGGLTPPLGGGGGIVEADETYFGKTEDRRPSKQRKDRPYTRLADLVPAESAQLLLLSSAAVACVHSTLRLRTVRQLQRSCATTLLARRACILTRAAFMPRSARNSLLMRPSDIHAASMCAMTCM